MKMWLPSARTKTLLAYLYTSRWIHGYATLGLTKRPLENTSDGIDKPLQHRMESYSFFVTQTNSKSTCLLVSIGNGIHSESLDSNKIVGQKNWKNTEEPESARKASGLENNDKPCRNLLSRPLSSVHHNQNVNLGITLHGSTLKKTRRKKLVSNVGKFKCVFSLKIVTFGCSTRTSTKLLATSLLLKRRSRDSVWAEERMQFSQQNQRHYKRCGTLQQSAFRDDTV